MNKSFERDGNLIKLTLVYDEPETSKAKKKVVNNFAKGANMPGFRKGKTPASVIKKMITKEHMEYMLSETFKVYDAIDDYINENDETVIDVEDIKLALADNGEFTVCADITLPEAIEIKKWDKLATKEESTVEEEAVDKFINNLYDVEDNYEFNDEEGAEVNGAHTVTLRTTELDEDGNAVQESTKVTQFKLNGESAYEVAVREATADKKVGETVEFKNPVSDKQEKAEIIEVASLPELNLDEFAKTQKYFEGCENGEDFKNKVREYLQRNLDNENNNKFFNELINALHTENPYEVPAALVERAMERNLRETIRMQFGLSGKNADELVHNLMSSDDYKAQAQEAATQEAFFDLFVEQFRKNQNIELTEEEAQKAVDEYKAMLPEGSEVDERTVTFIKKSALHDKVVDVIVDAQN